MDIRLRDPGISVDNEVVMFEFNCREHIKFHAKFLHANNGFVQIFNPGDMMDPSARDTEITLYAAIREIISQGWDCRRDGMWVNMNSRNLRTL